MDQSTLVAKMVLPQLTTHSTNRLISAKSNDSYLTSPAARRRAAIVERDQRRHEARIEQEKQSNNQSEIERQYLFREHVIGTVNHSKQRRIDLEIRSKLRPRCESAAPDYPVIAAVPVEIEQWRCSGAKTRILELNAWRDTEKTNEHTSRVTQLEQEDRMLASAQIAEARRARREAIQASFAQQKQKNNSHRRSLRTGQQLSLRIAINTNGSGHRSFTNSPANSNNSSIKPSISPSNLAQYSIGRDESDVTTDDDSGIGGGLDTPSANAQSVSSARFDSYVNTPHDRLSIKFPSIFPDNDPFQPISPMNASFQLIDHPSLAKTLPKMTHHHMDEFEQRTENVRYSPRSAAQLYLSPSRRSKLPAVSN